MTMSGIAERPRRRANTSGAGGYISSRGQNSPINTRLVNPGFLGEPVVIGLTDWAVSAREEHRAASKAFAIRFNARWDRASRLRAFDHEYTHLEPPCFPWYFSRSRASGRRSVGLHLPSRRKLTPTDPDCFSCGFDSGGVLQDPGDALLDRLSSLDRDFLSQVPKFLVLRGCDVEVPARLRG